MFFRKKKDPLKIQDIRSDCPDYLKERKPDSQEEKQDRSLADAEQTKRNQKREKKKEKQSMKSMRKRKRSPVVKILSILMALFAFAVVLYVAVIPAMFGNTSVCVEKVSKIMGLGSGNGTLNRYAGVIESQDEWKVTLDGSQTVKEIYVKEGDSVQIGDALFAYDKEEIQLKLTQAKLELEQMESESASVQSQIASLEKQKADASSGAQLDYEVQIQSLKANKKKLEYDMKNQQTVIDSLEKAAENAVVKSELAGVVKKIDQSVLSGGTEETDFISILAAGDYRVKAMVNEQNQWSLEEGASVLVRSRVDEEACWTGTIVTIGTEKPEGTEDTADTSLTTSSCYPFYVKLDSSQGLLLGQHVYVELDQGQEQEREGVWLEGYYLIQEEDKTYVWAENALRMLEKREVTLGEYDKKLEKYEILAGLELDDYIAFPTEETRAWMRTIRETQKETDTDSSDSQEEDFQMDEEIFQNFDSNDTQNQGENGSQEDPAGAGETDSGDDLGPVGSLEHDPEVCL